ncbi:MAG: ribosome biogenesis GTPase Der [Candidatus Nanosyncoccaceae bacterium]|jgi:GTP-binding protein
MSKNNLPTVAIVGQANVGKSSIFNRLVGSRDAIVAREAGTTRDSVIRETKLGKQSVLLVDTAGFKTAEDEFETTIQDQIIDATNLADVILVVLDHTLYPNHDDVRILRLAQKSHKPTILIINKSDLRSDVGQAEFRKLGADKLVFVSANHGRGFDELIRLIIQVLPEKSAIKSQHKTPDIKLSLIGRPNVGKSSLFNTLIKKQQAIVSKVAGTTRDLNRVTVTYKGQNIEIIDTAGVRKPGKQDVGIEKFSTLRTAQAIHEADVCLLVLDATEFATQVDQALAGEIDEAGRGLIIVIAKSDLTPTKEEKDEIIRQTSERLKFVHYAPLIFTSSISGKNVTKIFELTTEIMERRKQETTTRKLNQILMQAKLNHPPAGLKNTHPKLRYMVQTDTNPPWFVVYGSSLEHLHWSYKRYLDSAVREVYDYTGTPIKFSFRDSSNKKTGKQAY